MFSGLIKIYGINISIVSSIRWVMIVLIVGFWDRLGIWGIVIRVYNYFCIIIGVIRIFKVELVIVWVLYGFFWFGSICGGFWFGVGY